MTFDCIVLTDKRYLKDSSEPYKHNVFYEDDLVVRALQKQGLKVGRKAWDDHNINWSDTKCVLFRTTWDYFDRFDEFSKWLQAVSTCTNLINSKTLIDWNLDKNYLQDLEKTGIHIPETFFIKKGSNRSLKALHNELGWTETVLKPCISGAGRHTYRLNTKNLESHETVFAELIAKEPMMLQIFQHQIVHQGEVSLMLFNGQFTHAVLKKAKSGDFRVQDDFGGTVHDYAPSKKEISFAESAVNACPELPLYARVDMFVDNNDMLTISELELIEPELWFRRHPHAATVLAKAVHKKLSTLTL